MVPQCFGPRQKKISYEYCGYDGRTILVALLFGLYLIVPRRKSKGTIIMGSFVSPSVRRHNLVSATPPTVFQGF